MRGRQQCRPRCVTESDMKAAATRGSTRRQRLRMSPRYTAAAALSARGLSRRVSPAALRAQSAAPQDAAAAMAQYRRPLEEYDRAHRRLCRGGQRLLELDLRKAETAQCQARARRSACDRRLRARSAAGLYRAVEAAQSAASRKCRRVRPTCRSSPIFLRRPKRNSNSVPRLPQTDDEFKRAYAAVALAAGLTRNQVVRIYGFEATGNGNYDVEAGLEYNKHAPRHHHGARLQSVVGDQLGRARGRIRQRIHQIFERPRRAIARRIGNWRWRTRSRFCAG